MAARHRRLSRAVAFCPTSTRAPRVDVIGASANTTCPWNRCSRDAPIRQFFGPYFDDFLTSNFTLIAFLQLWTRENVQHKSIIARNGHPCRLRAFWCFLFSPGVVIQVSIHFGRLHVELFIFLWPKSGPGSGRGECFVT